MRIRQIVDRLPRHTIEMLQNHELWLKNGQCWPDTAADPEALHLAVQKLSLYGEQLLRYWIRAIGPVPITEERLTERVIREAGLAASETRAGLRELRACGILFAVRKSWGEQLLFMPQDGYTVWRRVLSEENPWAELVAADARRTVADSEPSRQYCGNQELGRLRDRYAAPLGRRLLRAYAALDRTGFELTAKRLFPKKTAAAIADLVDMPLTGALTRLRAVHGDSYPFSFALALDIAAELGLLVWTEDGAYNWHRNVQEDWLSGYSHVREAELIQLFTMQYGFGGPEEAFFASGLLLLEPRRTYVSDTPIASWQLDWIDTLQACGWAKAELAGDGSWTFGWLCDPNPVSLNDAAHHEPLIALPDGELIVPPAAKLSLRWLLEQAAQWVREDTVSLYRLTGPAVTAAAERGLRAASLLQALEEAACGLPLPEELVHAVHHWSSRAGRTSIEEAVALRCDSKEIADALAANNGLSGLLAERVGDSLFLIRPEDINQVRLALERAGWPPVMRISSSQSNSSGNVNKAADVSITQKSSVRTAASSSTKSTAAISFIHNEHSLALYELLPPPEYADAVSGWLEPAPSEWPAAWTKQLRSYHHSTRRQLLQQALAWGAPVQLNKGGRLVELVPERLDDYLETWAVTGYLRDKASCEPVQLYPEMWQEMKIIVPADKS